jgi:hypothetical protein
MVNWELSVESNKGEIGTAKKKIQQCPKMTASSGSADRFLELTLCTCVPVVIHEAINFFIHP